MADYLENGFWADTSSSAHHWASNTISVNITDLTAAEQTLAIDALQVWSEVANLTFTFTSSAANITYNNDGTGQAYDSSGWDGSGNMTSATIDISSDWWPNDDIYSYMFQTYIHETGHALGLGHQGPYNGSATYGVDNVFTNDTWQWSVMSYFSQDNYGGANYDYVITPQMADIQAVQDLYGAASTRTGDTTYGFNSTAGSFYDFATYSGTPAFTIYDGGGSDTLDASGYCANQTIDLTPGDWSSIGGYTDNIGIWLNSTIENAIGGYGNDTIVGNAAANILNGHGGTDTMSGLGGNDIYYVDNAGDVVNEAVGGGVDHILTSVSYALKSGQQIEQLTTWNAGTNALNLTGNAFGQTIYGNAGAERHQRRRRRRHDVRPRRQRHLLRRQCRRRGE